MRTIEQTTKEILQLATQQFQVPAGSLSPEDDFYKKLGIDSLQALEMLSRLEYHFIIELTYREFKYAALPLAKALQDLDMVAGERIAIIMTNQSKWLISAYSIFYCGATLVPLDFKLKPEEQWQLLKHSGARILITEHGIWRQLSASAGRDGARPGARGMRAAIAAGCCVHRLFLRYGRNSQGLPDDARKLSRAMHGAYGGVSLLARSEVPEHPAHEPRN